MNLSTAPPPPPRSPPPKASNRNKVEHTTLNNEVNSNRKATLDIVDVIDSKKASSASDGRRIRATFGEMLELFHDDDKSNEEVLEHLQNLFEEAVEEAEHELRNQPPLPPLPPPPVPMHTLDDKKNSFDLNEKPAASSTRTHARNMFNSNNSIECMKRNRQGNASDTVANKILRANQSARPQYRQQKPSKLLQKLASRT
ncbi:hypothetical protein ABG067_002277 [Albugo candida]